MEKDSRNTSKREACEYLDSGIYEFIADASTKFPITERMLLEIFSKHLAYVITNSSRVSMSDKIDLIKERIAHYIFRHMKITTGAMFAVAVEDSEIPDKELS